MLTSASLVEVWRTNGVEKINGRRFVDGMWSLNGSVFMDKLTVFLIVVLLASLRGLLQRRRVKEDLDERLARARTHRRVQGRPGRMETDDNWEFDPETAETIVQNFIDAIIPVIIFIAVISGIINSIRESVAKNAKQQAAPPPQSRVQSEIADFLSGKQRPASPPAEKSRPQPTAGGQKGNRQRQPSRPKPQRNTSAAPAGQHRPDSKSVGSGVSAHVDSFIGGHVNAHIGTNFDESVKKDMAERVKSDLGSQSSRPVEMSARDTGSLAADNLLAALRSPAGIRHAILVNEILSKPRALRKS